MLTDQSQRDVHSSNTERALWMAGEFDLADWRHWRVAPIGDDWIELDWRHAVRRILKKEWTKKHST